MATTDAETGYSNFNESNGGEFAVPPSHQIPAETSSAYWRRPPLETALQGYADAVGRTLGIMSRASRQLLNRASGYTRETYSQVERETKNLEKRTRENASYVKEQYPLEALGAIAAAAFVVGMALRFWRSRAS